MFNYLIFLHIVLTVGGSRPEGPLSAASLKFFQEEVTTGLWFGLVEGPAEISGEDVRRLGRVASGWAFSESPRKPEWIRAAVALLQGKSQVYINRLFQVIKVQVAARHLEEQVRMAQFELVAAEGELERAEARFSNLVNSIVPKVISIKQMMKEMKEGYLANGVKIGHLSPRVLNHLQDQLFLWVSALIEEEDLAQQSHINDTIVAELRRLKTLYTPKLIGAILFRPYGRISRMLDLLNIPLEQLLVAEAGARRQQCLERVQNLTEQLETLHTVQVLL